MAPNIPHFDVAAGPEAHAGKDRNMASWHLTGFPNLCTLSPVLGVEQVTSAQTPGMTAGMGAAWDASHMGQRH